MYMSRNIISVNVQEAYAWDVGRPVARIDRVSKSVLGAYPGDIIEITGRQRTVARCLLLESADEDRGMIRIDGLGRHNSGTAVGDTVMVRRINTVGAKKVVVAPLEPVSFTDENYLAGALANVPLTLGDTVMASYRNQRPVFQVVDMSPESDAVFVTLNTIFQFARHAEPHIRIGIVGTGMLGSAVAVRLATVGYDVSVYNRTTHKTGPAEDAGATVCSSPALVAAESDMVIMVVKDAAAIREVAFGTDGITNGHHDGLVVADMSTIDPSDSRHITDDFGRHGVTKIDVPVMGGPDAAMESRLVAMVSGNREAFEYCKRPLKSLTENIFFLGTNAGTAHAVKLGMNMQIAMLALSLSEGITLMDGVGADPKMFLDILNSTYFSTGMSRRKAYKMIDGTQKPTFTLANLRKDIGIMTEVANSLGLDLPMIMRAGEIYEKALKAGHGELDYTGIIKYIKKDAA